MSNFYENFGEVIKKDDIEYIRFTRTIYSTNCKVFDELRKQLREFDNDMFRSGKNTGSLYNVEAHEVYFSVDIPVTMSLEYMYRVVVGIVENINNYIDEIIDR